MSLPFYWIAGVLEGIDEQVEGHDGEEDGDARGERVFRLSQTQHLAAHESRGRCPYEKTECHIHVLKPRAQCVHDDQREEQKRKVGECLDGKAYDGINVTAKIACASSEHKSNDKRDGLR